MSLLLAFVATSTLAISCLRFGWNSLPFRVVNIGNSNKMRLPGFIEAIGKPATRNCLPMRTGDVPAT